MAQSRFHIQVEESVCSGDEFVATVVLDASDASINAAQGTLIYDPSQLTPVAIQYGNSILRYWVTPPSMPDTPGEIPFIGGLPYPGFIGNEGPIMSVIFRAEGSNVSSTLSLGGDAQAILNDGNGTPTQVVRDEAHVALLARDTIVCTTKPAKEISIDDTTPPLPFDVIITSSPKAFSGEHFAVFDTIDEGTGVDHYEVRETSLYQATPWLTTTSPYHLLTQGGEVLVEVRAVDGAGNTAYASASAGLDVSSRPPSVENVILIAGAVALGIIIFLICRKGGRRE